MYYSFIASTKSFHVKIFLSFLFGMMTCQSLWKREEENVPKNFASLSLAWQSSFIWSIDLRLVVDMDFTLLHWQSSIFRLQNPTRPLVDLKTEHYIWAQIIWHNHWMLSKSFWDIHPDQRIINCLIGVLCFSTSHHLWFCVWDIMPKKKMTDLDQHY